MTTIYAKPMMTQVEFWAKYPDATINIGLDPVLPPLVEETAFMRAVIKKMGRPLTSKELKAVKRRYFQIAAEHKQRLIQMRKDWYSIIGRGKGDPSVVLTQEFPTPQPYDEWGTSNFKGNPRNRSYQERLNEGWNMLTAAYA